MTHHGLNFFVDYVNIRLSCIFDWCHLNKLSINPVKSEFMLISNILIEIEPVLYLDRNRNICKNSVKYFDLLIDCNLKFTSHIILDKTKLSQLTGISHRIKQFFNIRTAKNYYYSCVYSVITNCLSAWERVFTCS